MPCCGTGKEPRIDRVALEAYIRSRGLTPKDRKWIEVWHRKKHRFTTYH